MSSDPKYDRGVKKLFGAYTQEDAHGERLLSNEALENLLEDFEICTQLAEWEEVAEALRETAAKPDKEGLSFNEFKKLLRKVAIYEFKKKKYGRQFPTHDDRHNALLEYLRADDVDKLLEHAHECNMARRQGQGDVYGQDTSLSSNDSYITSQPTVSKKKDSKKSSSKHRKAHGGSSGGDSIEFEGEEPHPSRRVLSSGGGGRGRGGEGGGDGDGETLEQKIERRQAEAMAELEGKRKREEEARRLAVEQIALQHAPAAQSGGGAEGRPQSATSDDDARPWSGGRGGGRGDDMPMGISERASVGGLEDGGSQKAHVSFDERDAEDLDRDLGINLDDDDDDDGKLIPDDDGGDSADEQLQGLRSVDDHGRLMLGPGGLVIGGLETLVSEGVRGGGSHGPSPMGSEDGVPARSRPQSSRPPSGGRHLRPESARPNREMLGSQSPAPGGVRGGSGSQPRPFELRCSYGPKAETVLVDGQTWDLMCAHMRERFEIAEGTPILITYKVQEEASGMSKQEACSCSGDWARLVSFAAKRPPGKGAMKAQVIMVSAEDSSEGEEEGGRTSEGLAWKDASLLGRETDEETERVDVGPAPAHAPSEPRAPSAPGMGGHRTSSSSGGAQELSGRPGSAQRPCSAGGSRPQSASMRPSAVADTNDRVEYVPGAGMGSPRDADAFASRRTTIVGRPGSSSRPLSANARPRSSTSRPMSAPRATHSSDMGCPVGPVMQVGAVQAGAGGSSELASVGSGLQGTGSSVPDASLARHAPGGSGGGGAHRPRGASAGGGGGKAGGGGAVEHGMHNNSVSVAPEKSGAAPASSLLDKLTCCIKLGVLPACVQLSVEVEYCTCKRPSATLRGSSEKYANQFKELENEVGLNMEDWDIKTLKSRAKPRIGAFEVTLVWSHNSFSYRVLLYSKLSSRLWPNIGALVASLREILPKPTDQVSVKVLTDSTQQAITDAHIIIQDPDRHGPDSVVYSAFTDGDGSATILAKEGMYNVIVEAVGHNTEEALLTLSSKEELPIRMTVVGVDHVNSLGASDPSFGSEERDA